MEKKSRKDPSIPKMLGRKACATIMEKNIGGGCPMEQLQRHHQDLQETMMTIQEIPMMKKEMTMEAGTEKRMTTGATGMMTDAIGTLTTGGMAHLSLRKDRCAEPLDLVRESDGA